MKFLNGVYIQPGTKCHDLLSSKDKKDHAKAKKLNQFCVEAEAINYEYQALMKLREKYKDIL